MNLTGLHILLTYTCNYECDHCFVWSGPWQTGVFTWPRLEDVFQQARELGTIDEIYFEGGEAFLYYPLLVHAVKFAHDEGWKTGIVSNGYWATSLEDARIWLEPLAGAGLNEIDVSSDVYHGDEQQERFAWNAMSAAAELGITGAAVFTLDPPHETRSIDPRNQGEPVTGGGIMFRGRAAVKLVEGLPGQPWELFDACPYENLASPSRVHLDPFGYLHLCQGLCLGNLFERPLKDIVAGYDPTTHPIVAELLAGGPAELVRRHGLTPDPRYVDACHLCYTARAQLRSKFPDILAPNQMYGLA
ncbi:MAG TPA: radical SAM protein [Caldilineae bacterium]|nr:radical SAM protein [Caldilineae bacterium]